MYIVAIAWLYVVLIVSAANTTVIGGVLTFLLAGVGPLALFLWIVGTPARRRSVTRRTTDADTGLNDRTESSADQ